MTKIKVDEKGLNARAMYRALNSDNWIIDDTQQSHPLTEPAEPDLVCEGDLVWQYKSHKGTWANNGNMDMHSYEQFAEYWSIG